MRSVVTIEQRREKRQSKNIILKFKSLIIGNIFTGIAMAIILLLIICAIVPQWIATHIPTEMDSNSILLPPSLDHLFGTDYFGRDVFSLVVYGSKLSILIGLLAVLVSSIVGSIIGMIAGYIGGIIETILMRTIEIIQTIPGILLALAITAAMGASFQNLILAIAVSSIPSYARVMRGQILSIKTRPYVLAARSIGVSEVKIFFKHVLPNSYTPLLVIATNGLGTAILVSAGLSFLGLGVPSEVPDWGLLLSQGRNYLAAAWWIATFPGLAIALFVLGINILGDSLRDYLDPKRKII